jgi:hypothetical protein
MTNLREINQALKAKTGDAEVHVDWVPHFHSYGLVGIDAPKFMPSAFVGLTLAFHKAEDFVNAVMVRRVPAAPKPVVVTEDDGRLL